MRLGRFSGSPPFRLAVLIVATLWGLISHSTYAGSGDEPHYLAIAHSLAFDRDLDLANNYGAHEPLIADGGLKPELHVQPGRGGMLRPVHDIGLPAVFVPWVVVMRPLAEALVAHLPPSALRKARLTPSTLYRHLVSTGMILITAFLAVLFRRFAIRTGTPPRVAFWGSALVVLSPPFLIFGVLFFTEVLCAVLFTVIVLWLFVERRWATTFIVFAGMGIGFLPFVHVRTVGLAAMLAIVAVWTLWRADARRQAILLASVVACGVLARGALNWFLWGTLITTPHARLGTTEGGPGLLSETLIRVLGLSVDQEFGLLPYFPVAVLALWGWRSFGNRNADLTRTLLLVSGAYLLTVVSPLTNAHGWTGGWSPPARFLVPVLPLLAIVVIRGLSVAPRAIWAPIVAIQLGLNLYFFSNPKNLWNDGDGVAAVCARGGATFCGLLPSFTMLHATGQQARLNHAELGRNPSAASADRGTVDGVVRLGASPGGGRTRRR
jgi:hypothetical protein